LVLDFRRGCGWCWVRLWDVFLSRARGWVLIWCGRYRGGTCTYPPKSTSSALSKPPACCLSSASNQKTTSIPQCQLHIVVRSTSVHRNTYRFAHSSNTSPGLPICNVNTGRLSCTKPSTRRLASCTLSPSLTTGLAVHLRKSVATTATNSTCDIFCPGHVRGPTDQGRYVPRGGVTSSGCAPSSTGRSQRAGLNARASGPQVEGEVCRAIVLTWTAQGDGRWKDVVDGWAGGMFWVAVVERIRRVTGGKRRRVSS
jgi:hypothetical protein